MTQDDKLKILKDILLKDEHEYASSIEIKLKKLEELITQQNNLSKHIDPILEEKLDEFIKEMPQTIGPTITKTLKEEIKNSQDEVVEALYPIMGKMIKRYVQKEIQILSENINRSMSNAFSFKNIFRYLPQVNLYSAGFCIASSIDCCTFTGAKIVCNCDCVYKPCSTNGLITAFILGWLISTA